MLCVFWLRSFIMQVTRKKHAHEKMMSYVFLSRFYYAYALIGNVKVMNLTLWKNLKLMNLNAVEKYKINEFDWEKF